MSVANIISAYTNSSPEMSQRELELNELISALSAQCRAWSGSSYDWLKKNTEN